MNNQVENNILTERQILKEIPKQSSLQNSEHGLKGTYQKEMSSRDTLPINFGQRPKSSLKENQASLWSLSSHNFPSTEQLVTLDQIEESLDEIDERNPSCDLQVDSQAESRLLLALKEQIINGEKAFRLKALQVEEYEKELKQLQAKMTLVEEKNENLRRVFESKLDQFENNLKMRRSGKEQDLNSNPLPTTFGLLQKIRTEAKTALISAFSSAKELRTLYGKLRTRAIRTEAQKIKLNSERNKLLSHVSLIEAGLSKHQIILRHRTQKIERLEDQLDSEIKAKSELLQCANKSEEQIKITEKENSNLRFLLVNAEEKSEEAVARISRLEAAIETVKKDKEDFELKNRTQNLQISEFEVEKKKKQLKISSQKRKIDKLKKNLSQKKRKFDFFRNSIAVLKILEKPNVIKNTVECAIQTAEAKQKIARRIKKNIEVQPHVCLSGRSLCPRRRHIENLKLRFGLK